MYPCICIPLFGYCTKPVFHDSDKPLLYDVNILILFTIKYCYEFAEIRFVFLNSSQDRIPH